MAASQIIGALSVFLGLNSASFSGGLKKAGGDVEAFKGLALKAFGAIAGALSIQAVANYADRWSDLKSRLTNATGSAEAGGDALDRLQRVARMSYSSIEQTANAFLDQTTTLNALGVATSKQLDLSEVLNNTLVISATRGEKATSVLGAWTKAMALGALRGDELNQVITGAPRLAKALADQLGTTVIGLREMGEKGLITRQVMLSLTDQMDALRAEAADMPATMADGWMLIGDAVFQFVGRMDQAFGASESFAGVLVEISDRITRATEPAIRLLGMGVAFVVENMDFLLEAIRVLFATRFVLGVFSMIGAMISFAKAIRTTGIVMAVFNKLLKGKLTLLALAVAVIAKLTGGLDMLVGWLEETGRALMQALPEELRSGIDDLGDAIFGLGTSIGDTEAQARKDLAAFGGAADIAADSVGNIGTKAEEAGEKTKTALEVAAEKAKDFAQKVGDFFKGIGGEIKGLIDGTTSWNDALMNVLGNLAQLAFSQINFGGIGNGDGSNGIAGDIVGGLLGGLFNFANGGSFKVGGSGGIDSQLVAFNASPDETVTVMTPQQQREATEGGGGGKTINIKNTMNVTTPDARSFKASEAQTMGRLAMATKRGARTL